MQQPLNRLPHTTARVSSQFEGNTRALRGDQYDACHCKQEQSAWLWHGSQTSAAAGSCSKVLTPRIIAASTTETGRVFAPHNVIRRVHFSIGIEVARAGCWGGVTPPPCQSIQ